MATRRYKVNASERAVEAQVTEEVGAATNSKFIELTVDLAATAAYAAMILGRMFQLPLAAGDSGVQGITGVVGTVASAGTFNLLVLRPLADIRIRIANDSVILDMLGTGLPQIFADSALYMIFQPDSTATQTPELQIDIVNG